MTGRRSRSFLKKTEKLLRLAGSTNLALLCNMPEAISKSFLLIFFKKEVLPERSEQ
jgi:hypothetical protein